MTRQKPQDKPASQAALAYPRVEVRGRAELREWLAAHHSQAEGVWLVTYKKRPGAPHLPYSDIVEEALCFGWIDSLPRKLDEDRTMLLLTPRKAGSAWSAANKQRVERMIEAGLMSEAGLRKVEEAKENGKWDFLDDVDTLAVPADLAAALDCHEDAKRNFAAFPPSTRRGILEWIKQAKRPETRARRVAETAELANRNIRANQWRGS